MVVGSMSNDVLAVNMPQNATQQGAKAKESKTELLCRQKQPRKVLEKGKMEEAMPSVKGPRSACQRSPCPACAISPEGQ